jgi:F-type H+-transporting ATPase subunit gamma
MAQTREIRRRINSVRNTQQITRAMKMVAAARLRKAQERMLAMRPYADRLGEILARVEYDLFGDEHPLFHGRAGVKTAATVVVAGDKGLCGAFNTNILRRAREHFDGLDGVEHRVYSIGKRATTALRKQGRTIVHDYQDVFETLSYVLANSICEELVEDFLAGTIDEAYVVYNEFVSVMSQTPQVRRILPIDFGAVREARKRREEAEAGDPAVERERREQFEFEPDPEVVMGRLVGRMIATEVYRATLESYAAELGARMTAMDAATTNADDMIERLTMEYNRARQAGITGELLDIVGGAEGLKG